MNKSASSKMVAAVWKRWNFDLKLQIHMEVDI